MDNPTIKSSINSAIADLEAGNFKDAQSVFNSLLQEDIMDTENLLRLGDLARRLGERVSAVNIFTDLAHMHPDSAIHRINLGQAYMDNGLLDKAEQLFREGIALKPELYDGYLRLGKAYIMRGRYEDAVTTLEKAHELKPGNADVYINLVSAYTHSNQHEAAHDLAVKLVRLEPKKAESYHLLGRVLSGLGKFDEAIDNFEKAISLNKTFGNSYTDLARIKKFNSDDRTFLEKAKDTLKLSMSAEQRATILFCLGKAYNDLKEWDAAFEYYRQGNLIHKIANYDTSSEEVYKKTHKQYTRKFFTDNVGLGSDSKVPVFIIGMPRSGTTLLEQVISSHPDAAGAGELMTIPTAHAKRFMFDKLDSYKKDFQAFLNAENIKEVADEYLSVLRDSREDAERVVDKLPDNFLYLGFIHLVFPKARIIHAVRSPIDTCLSNYFQIFRDITWANDLEWIARRYSLYRKAMDYWKSVIPEGVIVECKYEDMVADPYNESKRLIESIGLEWDEECLSYHEKDQAINTASLWQARQPVYKSSSKRWVNYAKQIELLATGLYEYLDDEDIKEFEKLGIKLKKPGLLKRLMG